MVTPSNLRLNLENPISFVVLLKLLKYILLTYCTVIFYSWQDPKIKEQCMPEEGCTVVKLLQSDGFFLGPE